MTTKKTNKKRDLIQLLASVLIIILINIIGNFAFKRIDLTSEKRFTLTSATKELVKNLDDVVYVKVYLEGDFPAGFKRLRNSTKEILDELRAISPDIEYEFINPSSDPDEKKRHEIYQQLTKQGLQYTNLEVKEGDGKSEKIIFPGAIFSYRGKEAPLQLLKSQMGASPEQMLNISEQQLEYEIANTIKKLSDESKPSIAFIEGHGELDETEVKDATRALSEYYDVKRIKIAEKLNSLKGISAIIIANPDSAFSEKDKFIIDQFIMRGGKVLWLINPVDAIMDSLSTNKMTFAIAKELNLDDQLFRYGIRINNNLVQDLQAAPIPVVTGYIGNQPQQKLFPWFYFPLLMPQSNHPIVNNLNALRVEFISSIDTVSAPGIKKTPLLHTSKYTKLLNAPVRISINSLREEPKAEQFNKSFQPVSYLLEGEFESAFTNRITPEVMESEDIKFKDKSQPTKMIVVGSGNIIKNSIQKSTGNVYPLGYDRFTGEIYSNKTFILNAMNYLCDDSGIIGARSKEFKLRLLDSERIKVERTFWQLLNTVLPVIIVLFAGIILFYIRKRKYS
ncbi:MAG: gliding motility-associated ABC transporter substrate-binding protein GldG [Bacteroidetes bacterium]|nr:gliding motility-associated ABC transporter substrate-binding protein GldG [Bacteroidota bacterium]HET6243046.1 gliding motility-associated ABC transporter substrate-binding protein GldG [Bacteroidia bacterium]